MQKLSLLFEKYIFWWVIVLSIFIPLYPKFPLINVSGTYVAIRLEDFLIAITVFWWFIAILPKIKNIINENITRAIIIFWVVGAVSLFAGIFVTSTVAPNLGFFHYLRRVETMMLFLVASTALTTVKQIKTWVWVMFLVTIGVVLYGFGQQYLQFPVISTNNREFSKGLVLFLTSGARVNSTFAGHYDLAIYLSFFLTALAAFFFYINKKVNKIWCMLVGGLSFVLLSFTAARVSFLAAIIGISASLFLTGHKKLILVLFVVSLMALVVSPDLRHRTVATITVNLLGGGGAKYVPPPQVPGDTDKFSSENGATGSATPSGVPRDIVPGEPINSTELGVYRSFGIRTNEEWPRAIRALSKDPLLGTGYSSITIATDNDYLRSLGEVGILGTLSLMLVFIVIVKKMWSFLRSTTDKNLTYYLIGGLLSGLLTIFITQTFIDVLESSKVAQLLWLSLGVGFAAIKIDRKNG